MLIVLWAVPLDTVAVLINILVIIALSVEACSVVLAVFIVGIYVFVVVIVIFNDFFILNVVLDEIPRASVLDGAFSCCSA